MKELIEKTHNTFAKYTIEKTLEVCKACCVTDDEEAMAQLSWTYELLTQ